MTLDSTLEDLRERIAGLEFRTSRWSLAGRVSAGVCVPLHEGARGLEVLMIKRPGTMRQHAREVAFPGGRAEPGDLDLLDTALRETWEELGLQRSDLEPLGPLSPVPTATSTYLLHPFVVVVRPGTQAQPHPGEVDVLIVMPLADFFAGRVGYHAVSFGEWNSPIFEFDAGSMYGASAHILEELLTLYARTAGLTMPVPMLTDRIPWQ
ncbi:MAG TPA: CoA pyrophosphatase [Candidatus Dormibacteraeota bacterium]